MVESIRETCRQGVHSYASTPREKWVLEWPGQVVLVVTGVYWTREVGEAMASTTQGALQAVADRNSAQLGSVVNLVRTVILGRALGLLGA